MADYEEENSFSGQIKELVILYLLSGKELARTKPEFSLTHFVNIQKTYTTECARCIFREGNQEEITRCMSGYVTLRKLKVAYFTKKRIQ